jgi:hypothetical protein
LFVAAVGRPAFVDIRAKQRGRLPRSSDRATRSARLRLWMMSSWVCMNVPISLAE